MNLSIESGEFVAIVGPSGSGKSTLLNILGLLDSPSTGSYLIDGVDVGAVSERARAAIRSTTFGFVFQSYHLQENLTALGNVELGLLYRGVPRATRSAQAAIALERVGLTHRAASLARHLSGGERQRVAIARAIVGETSVVVADEPTGSLDSENSAAIVDLLRTLAGGGTTVILVTHEAEAAAAAPRRILLRDGVATTELTTADPWAASRAEPALRVMSPSHRVRHRDLAGEASRGVASSPRRSAGVATAVAIAVGLVVALLGLTQTASAQVSDRFDARRNRQVDATSAVATDLTATSTLNARVGADLEERAGRLAGVTQVGAILDADAQPAATATTRSIVSIPVAGITPASLTTVGAQVRWATGHAHELGAHETLIGDIAAKQLELAGPDEDPTVLINGDVFAVVGVLDNVSRMTSMRSSLLVGWDDAVVVGRPTRYAVLVATQSGAAQQVASQLAIALDPVDPERFEIDAPRDPHALRAEVESDVSNTMLLLGVLAFLVAVAMTTTAMSAGVSERIGEFGLRRAIGARSRHVLEQVSLEALVLGAMGGAVGLFVGLLAVLATTIANGWQPILDLRTVPLAIGSGLVASLSGGLIAARRAARIQPIEALRHD